MDLRAEPVHRQKRMFSSRSARAALAFREAGSWKQLSFEELRALVDARAAAFLEEDAGAGPRLIEARQSVGFVVEFLASIEIGRAIAVVPAGLATEDVERRRLALQGIHPACALILYTSGSSSEPKAVQLSRRSVEANTAACIATLDFAGVSQQNLFLPLHYSFGLLGQLLPALACEVPTVLLNGLGEARERLESPKTAAGMWSGVPSHWVALRRFADAHPEARSAFTHIVTAGAPLPRELRAALRKEFPNAVVFANYGLTEACPRVLCLSSRDPAFLSEATGYPVPGWEVSLADEGELALRGEQTMLGYVDPGSKPSCRLEGGWLFTGDVASVGASGLVTILGRVDGQVKIAGEKVEVARIEATLRARASAAEAVIIAMPDAIYGQRLVAFASSTSDGTLSLEDLHRALTGVVPPQHFPRDLRVLAAFPRTAAGKVDRKALAQLAKHPSS